MSAEVVFGRIMRVLLAGGVGAIVYELSALQLQVECPLNVMPAVVQWSWFLAMLTLFAYTRIDFLYVGILSVRVGMVRVVAVAVLVLTAIPVVISSSRNAGCESVITGLVPITLLQLFYCGLLFCLLFSDEYLGVMRAVIRLGMKPTRFSEMGEPRHLLGRKGQGRGRRRR